ncbi:IclR family transcriptional regulator [Azospirillum himalayense]|uniref:IclR family transcriptional regulator n=1 Tax=Azospirillum himalayense TaxID=654847 RepID=A0ABW0GDL4_9PROT
MPVKTQGVDAVKKALDILRAFSQEQPTLSLSEISKKTGYVKSTALRMLISLEESGFITANADKTYSVGSEAFRIGSLYQKTFRLEAVIRPVMRDMVNGTGESASFFRREGNQRICLFREDSAQALREHVAEGDVVALDRGAAGRVLLEFSDTNPLRPATPEMVARLPVISLGERDPDIAGVAVPILSATSGLAGALTLSGPAFRMTPERIAAMAPIVIAGGSRISAALGSTFYEAWRQESAVGAIR